MSRANKFDSPDERWRPVVDMWIKGRNELPKPVLEAVGNFVNTFYGLAEEHELSPAHCAIALSHLFAPLVTEHEEHRPDHIDPEEWTASIYEAIRDSCVVATGLFNAVNDGRIIADEAMKTLRPKGRIN